MLAVDKRSISSKVLGVLSCSFFSVAVAQYVVPLNNLSWRVIQPELGISVPGSFPSQTHLDLYDAKVIGDPLYSLNYLDQRWVAQHNFTYSAAVNGLARNTSSTWLLFNGLDTFTSISLCGYHVASTNNQFRQYTFNVTSILPSCNERGSVLNINFGSAKNIVDAVANEPDQETWPPGVEQVFEFPHRQFMRKQQSDFGWDWGPALAPAGPWLPAYIVQLQDDQIYPHNTLVDVYKQGQQNNRIPGQSQPWIVNCSIDYIGNLPEGSSMRYWFEDARGRVVVSGHLEYITMQAQTITGSTLIEDDLVELWWPTGLGPQTLYILHIDITAKHHPEPIASVKRRIGFRTIVLNQEPVSAEQMAQGIAPGSHWHFEINGHDFFAKGSNFIPPDPFWPRVTESDIRTLFEVVVAANQNMLRVWSSGAYSPDFLYDVADELGILLWSEFEFGCSLYPVDQEFLDNVYEEAVYQVRRVNHHPSLAFWAGGNELENVELLLVNQTATEEDYIKYKDEYEHLFLSTLFPAIFENTHSISYSPSSTSNGYTTLDFTTPPYMTQRYQNLQEGHIYGTTDYYNYNASQAFNTSSYPIGRFSNEFGFHSMPSVQTWKTALPEEQLTWPIEHEADTMMYRNHHYPPGTADTSSPNYLEPSKEGLAEMQDAAALWFPFPTESYTTNSSPSTQHSDASDSEKIFAAQCLTTQLFQAAYYVNQIIFYRTGSSLPQRTLGALYWQLNDIWQAPSWSSIEKGGRWKVLHYAVRRAFEPVAGHAFVDYDTGGLEVWVVSDLWEDVGGVVYIDVFTWSGEWLGSINSEAGLSRDLARPVLSFSSGALNATQIFSGNLAGILRDAGHGPKEVAVRVHVRTVGRKPNEDLLRVFDHESWTSGVPLSEARLMDPGLTLEYLPRRSGQRTKHSGRGQEQVVLGSATHEIAEEEEAFIITARLGTASWVWLDHPSYPHASVVVEFADNGFWMAQGETRRVGFKVVGDETDGEWKRDVSVRSLWENTLPLVKD